MPAYTAPALTPDMQDMLARELPVLATVTDGRTPDLGPKQSLRVWDDRTLIYNENTGGQHLLNIQAGSRAVVAVIDRHARTGYRFIGSPEVYTSGVEYAAACNYAATLGARPPLAAILIRIREIHSLAPGPSAGSRIA